MSSCRVDCRAAVPVPEAGRSRSTCRRGRQGAGHEHSGTVTDMQSSSYRGFAVVVEESAGRLRKTQTPTRPRCDCLRQVMATMPTRKGHGTSPARTPRLHACSITSHESLGLGTRAATPIGTHALSVPPATPIRIALALVVFVAVVLILRGFALSKEPGRPATSGVGLMDGLSNASMGIVGPPIIVYYFLVVARRGRRSGLHHRLFHRHR